MKICQVTFVSHELAIGLSKQRTPQKLEFPQESHPGKRKMLKYGPARGRTRLSERDFSVDILEGPSCRRYWSPKTMIGRNIPGPGLPCHAYLCPPLNSNLTSRPEDRLGQRERSWICLPPSPVGSHCFSLLIWQF